MLPRLGYACVSLSVEDSSPRGTILRKVMPERRRALTAANLADLKRVLEFNVGCGVRMFRLFSDIVPFGSHPVNAIACLDEFDDALAEIGTLIRNAGMRVSMDPGQYTVLSSPDQRTVDAARADPVFHARLLDALGPDMRHNSVIHVAGADAHRAAARDRWSAAFQRLPHHVRARLILENDERLFGAEDVLTASAATGVPDVLDLPHHRVYAGPAADDALPDLMRTTARTWESARDGIPKIHYSTQVTGLRPVAHAEYVDPAEFARFLTLVPDELEFDCMLEAKTKDRPRLGVRDGLRVAA